VAALADVIRVPADVLGHAAVAFERERARHDAIEEDAVVADEQDGAVEIGDQLLQQFQRFDVEVVGGLVHDEHVGRLREQAREHQAVALAT
jgi:hypothetical protein